jgi:hypothetical protein
MKKLFQKLFTKKRILRLQSECEVRRIPITVNDKKKEIVVKFEHGYMAAYAIVKPQPLVCMRSFGDPFWDWYFTYIQPKEN